MSSKWLSVLVMGLISLGLATALATLVGGETRAGAAALWIGWIASLAATGLAASIAASGPRAWALLSLINGGISFALVLAYFILPASASAPYEPGADWLRSVDFTPPIFARLREAIASGYFAIGVIIAGLIFWAAAYLLWHRSDDSPRHAH